MEKKCLSFYFVKEKTFSVLPWQISGVNRRAENRLFQLRKVADCALERDLWSWIILESVLMSMEPENNKRSLLPSSLLSLPLSPFVVCCRLAEPMAETGKRMKERMTMIPVMAMKATACWCCFLWWLHNKQERQLITIFFLHSTHKGRRYQLQCPSALLRCQNPFVVVTSDQEAFCWLIKKAAKQAKEWKRDAVMQLKKGKQQLGWREQATRLASDSGRSLQQRGSNRSTCG